tara:strand:- start:491 stop:973 length:483 start_codon:yes stop_codon:yes gene_type:complete
MATWKPALTPEQAKMSEIIFDLPASLGADAESKLREKLGLEEAPQAFGYCLVAVRGDCGGGMSDKHDCIVLNGSHWDLVKDYLTADMQVSFLSADGRTIERMSPAISKLNDLGNSLIDCGVFSHKWHKRTDWVLAEMGDDGKPSLFVHLDYNMIDQGTPQ